MPDKSTVDAICELSDMAEKWRTEATRLRRLLERIRGEADDMGGEHFNPDLERRIYDELRIKPDV